MELLVVWLRVVLLFCDEVEFIRLCLTKYSETFKEFNKGYQYLVNFKANIKFFAQLSIIKITLNSGTRVGWCIHF